LQRETQTNPSNKHYISVEKWGNNRKGPGISMYYLEKKNLILFFWVRRGMTVRSLALEGA